MEVFILLQSVSCLSCKVPYGENDIKKNIIILPAASFDQRILKVKCPVCSHYQIKIHVGFSDAHSCDIIGCQNITGLL